MLKQSSPIVFVLEPMPFPNNISPFSSKSAAVGLFRVDSLSFLSNINLGKRPFSRHFERFSQGLVVFNCISYNTLRAFIIRF